MKRIMGKGASLLIVPMCAVVCEGYANPNFRASIFGEIDATLNRSLQNILKADKDSIETAIQSFGTTFCESAQRLRDALKQSGLESDIHFYCQPYVVLREMMEELSRYVKSPSEESAEKMIKYAGIEPKWEWFVLGILDKFPYPNPEISSSK